MRRKQNGGGFFGKSETLCTSNFPPTLVCGLAAVLPPPSRHQRNDSMDGTLIWSKSLSEHSYGASSPRNPFTSAGRISLHRRRTAGQHTVEGKAHEKNQERTTPRQPNARVGGERSTLGKPGTHQAQTHKEKHRKSDATARIWQQEACIS